VSLFLLAVLVASAQELKHRSAAAGPSTDLSAEKPADKSPDVVSDHLLNPPLRADSRIRFSPDGSLLLIQDQAGIFVLSHKPLRILLYADIGKAYPAAFSADSQEVSILNRNLVLTTWRLSESTKPQQRELPIANGCLDAQLSPDAVWIFCFTPEFVLDLYRTSDLQRVYSQRLGPGALGHAFVPMARIPDSPFSIPFGFMTASFSALADRGTFRSAIYFAPDARFLLVNEEVASFRLELPSLQKSNVPGGVRKFSRGILGFPSGGRVLVSDPKKDPARQILSLSSGETVGTVSFTADNAFLASNPRFALLVNFCSAGVTAAFDLEKNSSVNIAPNLGGDIFGDEVALLNSEGQLSLYQLGADRPSASGRLPLGPLPALHSALADPSLSTLLLSLQGSGAGYDLATGKRLAPFKSVRGVLFGALDSAFLIAPSPKKYFPSVLHWTKGESPISDIPLWLADKVVDLVSSQTAFVSYSFYDGSGSNVPVVGRGGEVFFRLRGLDPSTGRELWHHPFERDAPVPFSDPQGDRIVLGWKAQTGSAESAARRFPAAREAFKKHKLKDQDSFFEVLDAASGTSLGGVLVQFGGGPISFDSAFSVGNFLILSKDVSRVTVFRLNEGTLVGRFRGGNPTISEAAKLLALHDGSGRLNLYSLETGARIAERRMPDYINYLRFSEKGDRLLVLTAHQFAYVLDVKKTIESFPPVANEPVSEPAPEKP
jgi:hypothetical protein